MGYPTTLKYTKDFRELLGWDFTQFSCFNKSDTMLLVSSVKTTDFMDRRGFVAILSVLHSKILNSQLKSRLILEFLTISQSIFKVHLLYPCHFR